MTLDIHIDVADPFTAPVDPGPELKRRSHRGAVPVADRPDSPYVLWCRCWDSASGG